MEGGQRMDKSDLIEKVVERSNLPRKRAEAVVNLIFDSTAFYMK